MDLLLIGTIWVALFLFVAGQHPRRPAWFLAGAAACAIHMVIAMWSRYGWSHQAAMRATALQTADVYGLNWGGGIYANYLFVLVWIADALWRWRAPFDYAARAKWVVWTSRAFYSIVIVNAAVVFATGSRRWIGIALMAWLLAVWLTERRRSMSPPPWALPSSRPGRPATRTLRARSPR